MTSQGDAFERVLLGEVARFDEHDVVARSGVDAERLRVLWQALGFPQSPSDVVQFTRADVEAVRGTSRLLDNGLLDPDRLLIFARIMGQAFARLAEEQVALMGDVLSAEPALLKLATEQPEVAAETVAAVWSEILPDIEQLQTYVWRRHLLASGQRLLGTFATESTGATGSMVVVGFADLADYTKRTREMSTLEVGTVIEDFERRAYAAIVGNGARVVKTIGDEVMFVAEEPLIAAEVAFALADGDPPVHVGMARGQVLQRGGDLFGPVVNLASRCGSVARAGTIVVDHELAAELADVPSLELRRMPPVTVRGYDRLHLSVLRRARKA